MLNLLYQLLFSAPDIVHAAWQVSAINKVRITRTTLKKGIEKHPDFPSLLSVSDVFDNYGIANLTIKVKPEDLDELPLPFITSLSKTNSDSFFTVVKEVHDQQVTYFNPGNHQWESMKKKDFLSCFNGIALLTEPEEYAGEPGFEKARKIEIQQASVRYTGLALLFLCVVVYGLLRLFQMGNAALLPLGFGVVTIVGTILTLLLLWYDLDSYNPILKKICAAGNIKVNCAAILHSDKAKIFGISWSQIGFTFFAGNLMSLVVSGFTNTGVLSLLSVSVLLSFPYIIYSLSYQWLIVKQWCLLCLWVQAILLVQTIVVLLAGWPQMIVYMNDIYTSLAQVMVSYIISFAAVTLILPALLDAKKGKANHMELQRLKHNPHVFNALLARQKPVQYTPGNLGIKLGNPNGQTKIIKVCNPFCDPCAQAHKPLENLLENNPDLEIQIIFTASSDQDDIRRLPVSLLMTIAQSNDEHYTRQAMDDWYLAEKKDYGDFSAKHPMQIDTDDQNQKIDAMNKWCIDNSISYTPTVFINGRQLPDNYSIADLKYFLAT